MLRPGGSIAVWTYGRPTIEGAPGRALERVYLALEGDWPPERAHVDAGYATLAFPFPAEPVVELALERRWSPSDVLGYVRTWSAVRARRRRLGRDPLPRFEAELTAAWGDRAVPRPVRWPLRVRLGRLAAKE